MPYFICTNCGTQFAESSEPLPQCTICAEEREFIAWDGQSWTTADELARTHRNVVSQEGSGLIGIGMEPTFAIGQRALLVRRPEGNVLWDCIPLLDESLAQLIEGIGGLSAIAISHPHYYASMVDWAERFDCPVLLHEADRKWVMRPSPAIEFWEGDNRELGADLTLIRCGGHFAGGTVLHWSSGADGRGVLLSGDIIYVAQDRQWVSFMYSFPNRIPLSADKVEQIVSQVEPYPFERIHGAWWDKTVSTDAKAAVRRSARRYIQHLRD
ncbi:Metallo-beta-lactamase superfamily protein [Gimesia chilikensis]|uniref:Metallo-beta-lactamase superfamily protein n=1 Tax=Gimesia chilikensis TaxID=2605989 RepID=A0A517WE01_9PLAN|nr:MBL fold metallo-hydrolase [Gimesia chilikensis]QDU03490.1 Metallo-beta-lactamase superfamily protein [Gimesia chilikensis]